MKNNRVLSLIGLATKAGKTVSGEFSTEKSVKTGKGLLVEYRACLAVQDENFAKAIMKEV